MGTQGLVQDVSALKYTLVPGACDYRATDSICDVYNRVYEFWKDFWTGVLRDNRSPETLNCDAFQRPLITAILHNEKEIAALHMYSAFDLRQLSHRDHSYFRMSYPQEFVDNLRAQGHRSLLTMEFLTVSPNWRKSRLGFSLADVIMSLGIKIFQQLEMDCFVTLARGDVKVPQLLKRINFETHGEVLERHNTPCEAMMLPASRIVSHPDPVIADLVEHFWKSREDFSDLARRRIPGAQAPLDLAL
jgi:hypothetical protein